MSFSVQYLWLIPALPLVAAALGALTPRTGRRFAAAVAITGISASFAISIFALCAALADPSVHQTFNFAWFDLGIDAVRLGWVLDPLTAFMAGTFYRSITPGGEPLVQEGAAVAPGTVLGVLESMKIMNEISSESQGIVKRILCENAQVVSAGQPLFELQEC